MHIQYNERRSIERYKNNGNGTREIARKLERSVSSISEEIKRGSVNGRYRADRAENKAALRRKQAKQQCLKVAMDTELKEYVIINLKNKQSPEAIAGRIKYVDTHISYVGKDAIYNFVASVHGRVLERFLYWKRVQKKSGRKRGRQSSSDSTKIPITKRSEKVNTRLEFGHFEGDFIESGRDGNGSLLVLVERMTRYPFIIYTEDKTTLTINELIATTLKDVPVRSITLDNDISFQKHEELTELVEAVVYFARPYTSSDKGTVENRNKAIREFAPKRCDISKLSPAVIREAEQFLRTRFMKCLHFKTAEERWDEELLKVHAKIQKTTRVVVRN